MTRKEKVNVLYVNHFRGKFLNKIATLEEFYEYIKLWFHFKVDINLLEDNEAYCRFVNEDYRSPFTLLNNTRKLTFELGGCFLKIECEILDGAYRKSYIRVNEISVVEDVE